MLKEKSTNGPVRPKMSVRTRSRLASMKYTKAHLVRLIVVTGDHGKSTAVRLVAELLRESGAKVVELMAAKGAEKNFETDPFLLYKRLSEASKQGFDYAILEAHDELLKSGSMSSLDIDTLVVTTDNRVYEQLSVKPIKRLVLPYGIEPPSWVEHHNVMTFGADPGADMAIENHKLYRKGTELSLIIDQHTPMDIATYLVGEANALNTAVALATVYILGVNVSQFAEGVARVERVEGNYDYIKTGAPYAVVIDQGGTGDLLGRVVDSAKKLAKRRLIVALDMDVPKDTLAEIQKLADRLIIVGDQGIINVDNAKDHEEAALVASRGAKLDDLVLLIGRSFTTYDENGQPAIGAVIGVTGEKTKD